MRSVLGARRSAFGARLLGCSAFGTIDPACPNLLKTGHTGPHAWMCKSGIRYAQIVTASGTATA
jgi:hypothetical protein